MTAGKAFRHALVMTGALMLVTRAWADCDPSQPTQTPSARYVIKDGEVYDKKTDLTWQRCSVGQTWKATGRCEGAIDQMSWSEAMSQTSNGWRLPTKDELATLISPTCKNPAINEEIFPGTELDRLWYWSSTPYDGDAAWNVGFGHGRIYGCYRWFADAVRLVRSGQGPSILGT